MMISFQVWAQGRYQRWFESGLNCSSDLVNFDHLVSSSILFGRIRLSVRQ
jgi:hypothetical protein